MPKWLARAWGDQVWSKVIGTLIAAAITGALIAVWQWAIGFKWLDSYSVPGWGFASAGFLVILLAISTLYKRTAQSDSSKAIQQPIVTPNPKLESGGRLIKLTLIDTEVITDPKWGYTLKYFVHFRNDSDFSLDVKLIDYVPETVELQKKVFDVLQVKWNTYFPLPDGAPRVAVYPGQMMQLWLGLDPKTNPGLQVTRYKGKFGTLILSVNDEQIKYHL